MRKLALAVPFVLAIAACGSDTKSCSTKPAELAAVPSGCTLAAGTTVSLQVRPSCQTCSDTSPTCETEIIGSEIQLNPVFRECAEDRGCPNTGCAFQTFSCVFTTPNASQQYTIVYPVSGGSLGQQTVTVGAGGGSSCNLALADGAGSAP